MIVDPVPVFNYLLCYFKQHEVQLAASQSKITTFCDKKCVKLIINRASKLAKMGVMSTQLLQLEVT